jgi:serine protease Do
VKTTKRLVSLRACAALFILIAPLLMATKSPAAVSVLAPNTIADIAQAASPAVVNIEVDQTISASNIPFFQIPFGDLPYNPNFEFFFNGQRVHPPNLNRRGGPSPMPRHYNMGSGFIVRPDGYILTNAHVVSHASEIKVTLSDKRVFKNAKVVGTDGFSDLAVLKIDATDLPTLKLGTSAQLRPGDFAIAIGNPVGLDHTVTFGIISAVARDVHTVNENINFIQTDAAINPGNSGGPLLNLDGEVIGVNTAIQANAQSIGFSIPIDTAKSVVDSLIAGVPIVRPWLGIRMEDVNASISKSLGLPTTTQGVHVAEVIENSPAQKGGLEHGDIIQKIDGKDVVSAKEIQDAVHAHKVQDTLHFYLLRNKVGKALSVNIGNYPSSVPELGPSNPEEEN